MTIKLIACDLDGTVFDDDKNVDSGLLEVVGKLRKQGILFTIVSGRNKELFDDIVRLFEVDCPYVCNNGGLIYRGDEKLEGHYIPREYNNDLTRILYEYDMSYRLFADEENILYGESDFFARRMKRFVKSFTAYDVNRDISGISIFKITCDFNRHVDRTAEVLEQIRRTCPNMAFLKAEKNIYCANNLHANKGEALESICRMMGIGVDEVMAFGDNENDLSMILKAGWGVAMGNSDEMIRRQADDVCGDNNHNGVSGYLKNYFRDIL